MPLHVPLPFLWYKPLTPTLFDVLSPMCVPLVQKPTSYAISYAVFCFISYEFFDIIRYLLRYLLRYLDAAARAAPFHLVQTPAFHAVSYAMLYAINYEFLGVGDSVGGT
eukprot:3301207-Rhodomonas_salina.1